MNVERVARNACAFLVSAFLIMDECEKADQIMPQTCSEKTRPEWRSVVLI